MAQKPSLTDKYRKAALEEKPQRGNLIDDMLGSAMKLPEIMKVLEQRDAEKNKGWLGIDKRTIDEVTRGIMGSSGKFEDVVGDLGKSLERADARRAGSIKNEFAQTLGLAQEAQKQRQLDEANAHDFAKASLGIEAAQEAAKESFENSQELERLKAHLKRGEMPQFSPEGLLSKRSLDPVGLKIHHERMAEVNKQTSASEKLVEAYDALKVLHEDMEKAGIKDLLSIVNPVNTALKRGFKKRQESIDKNILENKEKVFGRQLTNFQSESILEEMPDMTTPLDAALSVIDRLKGISQDQIAEGKFFDAKDREGFVPTEIGYMRYKEENQKKVEKRDEAIRKLQTALNPQVER